MVYSGKDAVTVTGAGNGVQYTATGLSPDTTYTFGGYLKSGASGDPVYLGVKGYGGTETAVPVSSTQWTPVWVTFTTGAEQYKRDGLHVQEQRHGPGVGRQLHAATRQLTSRGPSRPPPGGPTPRTKKFK